MDQAHIDQIVTRINQQLARHAQQLEKEVAELRVAGGSVEGQL
jgi:hypothetical protein